MALQSSGTIGLGNIQTVFGGTNPIAISEYYSGGSFVAAGTAGIPTTGQIGLSNFYGKGPTVTDSNVAAFNATNTNIAIDGTELFNGDNDDGSYSFTTSTIGWTFFVAGSQVTTLTVSSNAFFQFTAGSAQTYNYSQADRRGYNFTYALRRGVLRFTCRHAYFYNATDRASTDLMYEFLFYRTSSFQYIEARANSSMKYSGTSGTFNGVADFQGISLPQLTAGTSYVLRSDVNGNNWRLFSTSTVSLAPPVSSGLVGMYTPQSWIGTQWTDLSGSGNNATLVTGTIARNIFFPSTWSSFISGGTAANLTFPTAILPSTYTLFYVARYVGPTRARIFTGSGTSTNWLSGFWSALSGVAWHSGWMTQSSTSVHGDNWFYATDQNNLFRSQGVNRTTGTAGTPSFARLTINGGFGGSELSDWAVATVLVYNRTLNSTEISSVESFLANMFGI
jgi:hypothetical protein